MSAKSHATLDLNDEMVIRYDVLPGDITFRIGPHDFSAKWGWIPLVDFVLSLEWIVTHLADADDGSIEVFDFTENGARIEFERSGNEVSITTSYADGEGRVPLQSLRAAVDQLESKVQSLVIAHYPSANKSRHLREFLR